MTATQPETTAPTTTTELLPSAVFLARNKGLIGKNAFYARIREGSLPYVRNGRKILVPADALTRQVS